VAARGVVVVQSSPKYEPVGLPPDRPLLFVRWAQKAPARSFGGGAKTLREYRKLLVPGGLKTRRKSACPHGENDLIIGRGARMETGPKNKSSILLWSERGRRTKRPRWCGGAAPRGAPPSRSLTLNGHEPCKLSTLLHIPKHRHRCPQRAGDVVKDGLIC
jgi:hypothetical protein